MKILQHDTVADTNVEYLGVGRKIIQAMIVTIMGDFLDKEFIYVIFHMGIESILSNRKQNCTSKQHIILTKYFLKANNLKKFMEFREKRR